MVAGRKPTRRELEDLAASLREVVPAVTIVDEQRLEVGETLEVLLEEVRIEVPESALALTGATRDALEGQVLALADAWLTRCAADPGAAETLAERIARQAVVDEGAPPGGR